MSKLTLDSLHKLININIAVNDNYDNFEVVLQKLLHAIEVITNSETTSLLVYDENKKDLVFRFATGATAHDIIGLRVPEGRGVAHAVANSRKGIVVNNPEEFGHYPAIDKKINYNTKNLMAFPVLDYSGEVFGVVEACNKKGSEKTYTKDDFQLLTIFCLQAERTIRHALHIHTLKDTIINLQETLEDLRTPPLIYISKEMKNNVDLINKISSSDSPVLITGKKGTGKTLVAKHIHNKNHRKANRLIEIDCIELMRRYKDIEALRIQLWGIDKDYKINVKRNIVGLFEQANRGTVIIKEITVLPIQVQNEILELLTHRLFTKVASKTPQTLDLKVICTSAIDFIPLIKKGQFVEELFFIINSLSINLPPLSVRIEDIQQISEYYVDYYIKLYKKNITSIDPEVFVILKKYIWKYNIHSLRDTISHLVLCCETSTLTRQDIASYIYSISQTKKYSDKDTNMREEEENFVTLQEGINRFKSQYIHKVLLHNNWNHTETSKLLNIQRSYLSRLVKDYNLKNKATSSRKK